MSRIVKVRSKPTIERVIAGIGRMLGVGIVGGFCGSLLGLANGVVHMPSSDPGEPLANEWYTPYVFMIVLVEGVVGCLMGAGVGAAVASASRLWRIVGFTLAGAVVGLGLGRFAAGSLSMIDIHWGWELLLPFNVLTQFVGAIAGMMIGVVRTRGRDMALTLDDEWPVSA